MDGADNRNDDAMKNDFDLRDYLPYLLNRAAEKIAEMFSEEVAPLGGTRQIWRVLSRLWVNGPYRLSDLATDTSIEISTLSRLVVTMQRKRLVVRRRSPEDGRALTIALTNQGRALTERIVPIAITYEEAAIRGLSAAETREFRRILKKIYVNLKISPPSGLPMRSPNPHD